MKTLGMFAAMLLLLSSAATAQSCKSITGKAARLACYDKADPGLAASAVGAQPVQGSSVRSRDGTEKYVDTIGAEDALMNARLKNICRGC